jgi:hypothetical protein
VLFGRLLGVSSKNRCSVGLFRAHFAQICGLKTAPGEDSFPPMPPPEVSGIFALACIAAGLLIGVLGLPDSVIEWTGGARRAHTAHFALTNHRELQSAWRPDDKKCPAEAGLRGHCPMTSGTPGAYLERRKRPTEAAKGKEPRGRCCGLTGSARSRL